MSRIGFSHVGLCVADVERSLRFYIGALGFEQAEAYEVDDTFSKVLEVGSSVNLKSQFIIKDSVRLEFLEYVVPGHHGSSDRRPLNQLGLTHISVTVDAIEPVVNAVLDCGGAVHRETYLDLGTGGEFIYCTDPDGIRVELMRLPN